MFALNNKKLKVEIMCTCFVVLIYSYFIPHVPYVNVLERQADRENSCTHERYGYAMHACDRAKTIRIILQFAKNNSTVAK